MIAVDRVKKISESLRIMKWKTKKGFGIYLKFKVIIVFIWLCLIFENFCVRLIFFQDVCIVLFVFITLSLMSFATIFCYTVCQPLKLLITSSFGSKSVFLGYILFWRRTIDFGWTFAWVLNLQLKGALRDRNSWVSITRTLKGNKKSFELRRHLVVETK